jgi:bacillithiol biosynthesis deacetylase BshB1
MRVLAIGAHPDDVEIGMGGTVMALLAQGHEVVLCDLTNGEPTPIGSPERRAREAHEAARVLGVQRRITLEMPNRYLMDTVDNRSRVAEVIRQERPELLMAPYWVDAHPDHVAAAALTEAARFYARLTKTAMAGDPIFPRRIVHFVTSHYRLHVRPTFIFDISNQMDLNLQALRAYGSQFGPERGNEEVFDRIRAWNQYFGSLIGCAYGEPFVCREELGLRSLEHFV